MIMPKKTLLWWSSGKDSAWALHVLRRTPGVTVAGLVTTVTRPFDRVAMHAVRRELVQAQAEAAGLPLHVVEIPYPCPNDAYERAVRAFTETAKREGVTHMAFGDLFLEDVRAYREKLFEGSGVAPLFPLWGRSTPRLARAMLDGGLRAVLTCVDPRRLDASFAGRPFDHALLADLPPEVDPCGERGAFHTFAFDGPMFAHSISVETGAIVSRDGFVFADVLPVENGTPGRFGTIE